jgi:glyoxylase I family protein
MPRINWERTRELLCLDVPLTHRFSPNYHPEYYSSAGDHVVLRVNDLDAMPHFYCDVLGCRVEGRQEVLGLIQLRAGRSLIDLVTVDGKLGREGGAGPSREGRNMDHLCLRVDPFAPVPILAELRQNHLEPGRGCVSLWCLGRRPRYIRQRERPQRILRHLPLGT